MNAFSDTINSTLDDNNPIITKENLSIIVNDITKTLHKAEDTGKTLLDSQVALGKQIQTVRHYIKYSTDMKWLAYCEEGHFPKRNGGCYGSRHLNSFAALYRYKSIIDEYCDNNNKPHPTSMRAYIDQLKNVREPRPRARVPRCKNTEIIQCINLVSDSGSDSDHINDNECERISKLETVVERLICANEQLKQRVSVLENALNYSYYYYGYNYKLNDHIVIEQNKSENKKRVMDETYKSFDKEMKSKKRKLNDVSSQREHETELTHNTANNNISLDHLDENHQNIIQKEIEYDKSVINSVENQNCYMDRINENNENNGDVCILHDNIESGKKVINILKDNINIKYCPNCGDKVIRSDEDIKKSCSVMTCKKCGDGRHFTYWCWDCSHIMNIDDLSFNPYTNEPAGACKRCRQLSRKRRNK